jgi:capsular polysaccharide biosynthesis protein
MELREYFSIIKKRFSIILLLTLVSTLISFVVSFFVLPKVYESATTLYVGKQVDVQDAYLYQDIMMGQTLVKDYREIAKSKTIVKQVKRNLQDQSKTNANLKIALELNDQDFAKKISVNLKNDTRIIEIKVTDTDPTVSKIIANDVAIAFQKKATELLKLDNIQILDEAEVPIDPVKPDKKLNIAIAFFVGALAGFGLAFLLEYLDTTIKNPEDVTKQTGMIVIGVIPKFELIEKQ